MGGTFDPVHYGHLRSALELKQALKAAEIRLIPCAQPVHKKQTIASAEQRLAMLHLAVDGVPGFKVDDIEIKRDSFSYTVDTLRQLRAVLGEDVPIVWSMGTDAFKHFTSWHQWQDILQLAHLVVIARAGEQDVGLSPLLKSYVSSCSNPSKLHGSPAGAVCFLTLTPLHISSTRIRIDINLGRSVQFLLPDKVLDYINDHKIYG